jgi:hypothetical protein
VEEMIYIILKFWGKGTRGRGRESSYKDSEKENEVTNSQNTREGRRIGGCIGFGRGKYVITFYRGGVYGQKVLKCPERKNLVRRNEARKQFTQEDDTIVIGGNVEVLKQEKIENMMFIRVLLNHETKAVEDPKQRKRV